MEIDAQTYGLMSSLLARSCQLDGDPTMGAAMTATVILFESVWEKAGIVTRDEWQSFVGKMNTRLAVRHHQEKQQ